MKLLITTIRYNVIIDSDKTTSYLQSTMLLDLMILWDILAFLSNV